MTQPSAINMERLTGQIHKITFFALIIHGTEDAAFPPAHTPSAQLALCALFTVLTLDAFKSRHEEGFQEEGRLDNPGAPHPTRAA